MDDVSSPPPLEALLEHRRFVRALARGLVRDAALAEDLEQETWVAALENPPRRGARAWLRAVVRNLAFKSHRSKERRRRREEAAARPEPRPATVDLVAREAALRAVTAAVLALDPPLREVVLLRFYEDLPPRGIAARLSLPVNTVRGRLQRALAALRARLDREHRGDRSAWLPALVGFAAPPEPPAPTPASAGPAYLVTTGVIMATKTQAAVLGAAAVLLVVGWAMLREEGTGDAGRSAAVPSVSGSPVPREGPAAVPDAGEAEARKDTPAPPAAAPAPAGPADPEPPPKPGPALPERVRGRVVDDRTGAPIPGAHVLLALVRDGRPTHTWGDTSDDEGAFELGVTDWARTRAAAGTVVELRIKAAGYGIVRRPLSGGNPIEETLGIRMAPLDRLPRPGRIRGVVRGAEGRPHAGRLAVVGYDEFGDYHRLWTRAGDDGVYVLEGLAPGPWTLRVPGGPADVPVFVPEGDEAWADLAFGSGGFDPDLPAEGRTLEVTGIPAAAEGARYLRAEAGPRHFYRCRVEGDRAVFEDLPVRAWTLVLETETGEAGRKEIAVVAGEGPQAVDFGK